MDSVQFIYYVFKVISITYDDVVRADLNFEHSKDKVNQFFMCFTLAVQLHCAKEAPL